MSRVVESPFGVLRRVGMDAAPAGWLFHCPCGEWLPLTHRMLWGKESIDHAADGCPRGYHETHNFVANIVRDIPLPEAMLRVDCDGTASSGDA